MLPAYVRHRDWTTASRRTGSSVGGPKTPGGIPGPLLAVGSRCCSLRCPVGEVHVAKCVAGDFMIDAGRLHPADSATPSRNTIARFITSRRLVIAYCYINRAITTRRRPGRKTPVVMPR